VSPKVVQKLLTHLLGRWYDEGKLRFPQMWTGIESSDEEKLARPSYSRITVGKSMFSTTEINRANSSALLARPYFTSRTP
jgi:hypothetical protein